MQVLTSAQLNMKKAVNSYLQSLLTDIRLPKLSAEDKKKVSRSKVEFIVNKLSRKKFRKRKLADETKKAIIEKVRISLDENRPIHFMVPFGGYKHFWNPSHPEPDWAELFNFRYLTDFVAEASLTHKPGVIIEYISEDMILNRMNNYPKRALEQYSEVFSNLVDWYNKQIPPNIQFQFKRVKDVVDANKLLERVENLLPERREPFEKLSKKAQEIELHRSYRSIFWNGDKDLSKLNPQEKQKRIVDSRLIELAYYDTEAEKEFLGDYLFEDNHICICFSFGTSPDNDEFQDLTLGSTYGSLVDHWIGRGILQKRKNSFSPRIISQNQYTNAKEAIEIVSVDNLLPYKNFQSIEVRS